jgi:hypothetical protein
VLSKGEAERSCTPSGINVGLRLEYVVAWSGSSARSDGVEDPERKRKVFGSCSSRLREAARGFPGSSRQDLYPD